MFKRWLAAIGCFVTLLVFAPAGAVPSYMSYWGLGKNIGETQDHVNLYWDVSWAGDREEILDQLADAKQRGMRAMVHTEFAFWTGDCPRALQPDAASRWASFAQALADRGLLDSVAAFYPTDEPDYCQIPPADVLAAFNIIRTNLLTAAKPIAVVFSCDVAQRYGGIYQITGEHQYGEVLRSADWVGFDCYGTDNIFVDPAWYRFEFDLSCFCFRNNPGPSYYDNFKRQLDLPRQKVMLIPQGFIAVDALPDDPQLFAAHAFADPAVILIAPFIWFDQLHYPGVRSQPALAQQWRTIGRTIALANPPNANPPLPAAIPPRLEVVASDVQHFSVYDLTCNTTDWEVCAVEVFWQAPNPSANVQVFRRQDGSAPALVSCAAATSYADIPWITVGSQFEFDLYQMPGCPSAIAPGATLVARLDMSLGIANSLPEAPTAVTAVAGDASISVGFTPGALGSGVLAYYTADCGGIAVSGGASPIVVTGLANGMSYTCRVSTTTTNGTGPWSASSASVTPRSANANLADLKLSAGLLFPAFAPGTTSYTAGLASTGDAITLTPTTSDPGATIKINGATVASGSASAPITLVVGSNPIAIVVTAQDGVTTRTYSVDMRYLLPSSCTYSLSPPELASLPAAGSSPQITVTTPAGCPVTGTSFQPWVTISGIIANPNTTTVTLQIMPNAGPARSTVIVVADRLFLITQLGP